MRGRDSRDTRSSIAQHARRTKADALGLAIIIPLARLVATAFAAGALWSPHGAGEGLPVIALALQCHDVDRAGALPPAMRRAQVDKIVWIVVRSDGDRYGRARQRWPSILGHMQQPGRANVDRAVTVAGILVAFTHNLMPL